MLEKADIGQEEAGKEGCKKEVCRKGRMQEMGDIGGIQERRYIGK